MLYAKYIMTAHNAVLDGWRGLSILLVLAAHTLPLGPNTWGLNVGVGLAGMALFFILSGFLITTTLLNGATVPQFITRRAARILPLAWLYIFVCGATVGLSEEQWRSHLLFYANLQKDEFKLATGHLWSLCVEIQFYIACALSILLLGRRGLTLLAFLALAITGYRVEMHSYASIATQLRIDELLAGCALALILRWDQATRFRQWLGVIHPAWLILLFAGASSGHGWFLSYARPYLAMVLVGWTILRSEGRFSCFLAQPWLRYVASISFALYILHPLLMETWLSSGDTMEKYAKRPLLYGALFLLAHVSTRYFETPINQWARSMFPSKKRISTQNQA